MKILLATNNAHKATEFSRMLAPLGIEVITQREAGINLEVEETGTTFEENAALKARAVFEQTGLPTVADDSGLEVEALGNAPGIYSARYGGPELTDEERYHIILNELRDVPKEKRAARFVCVICFIDQTGCGHVIRGECPGWIGYEPKGTNGFGYDPVFMVGEKSFSELTDREKDAVSHRGNALKGFYQLLETTVQKKNRETDREREKNADK